MKRPRLILLLPLFVALAACTRDPKEVAKKYVASGNNYYDKGQYKEASIMYRRALQKNMLSAQAHYRLGLVELKQTLLGEALRSFRRATDIDSDPKKQDTDSKLDAAARIDAFAKMGQIELFGYMSDPIVYKTLLLDLKDAVDKITKIDPKAYEGLRLSAHLALAEKDVARAIQRFREADQVKPDQPDLLYALVQALYLNKQPEEAEATAKHLIAKHKDYAPPYDILYVNYATTNRPADAERILKEKVANNPKNSRYLMELATHFFATNNKDEMNATIARLTSDPKNIPDGHKTAGEFFTRINDLDRALREYQAGEKSDPKDQFTYAKHEVEILARMGKIGDAAKLVGQLVNDHPKDTETVSMHAALLVQSKDPKQVQKAIDELTPMVSTTPQNQYGALQVLHFNLARAYMAKGDSASFEQARLQLQEALKIKGRGEYLPAKLLLTELLLAKGEAATGLKMADEIIDKVPNNLSAHLMRSLALAGVGDVAQARKELAVILHNSPNNRDALYQLANIEFTEKHYKEAQAVFDLLVKAKDPRGLQGVVNCKVRLEDFGGAIQLMQDQIKQEPGRADYRRVVAEIETEAKRFDDAIGEYRILIQKDPSAFNYTRLGDIQRRAGRLDDCIASFEKARELAPREPLPILQLGMIYDLSGRGDDARKAYEEVLKIQPDNPEALNNLAYSKADQGVDLDQALTYAERARTKVPDSLDISDTIGLIYLRKNLIDDSVRVLGDVVSRAPTNATFHLHYAMALYQKGDKPAAKKELDLAVRNGPSEKEKLRIQELRLKLS
jgi:tetratricopeptide (TPR) repeat protein